MPTVGEWVERLVRAERAGDHLKAYDLASTALTEHPRDAKLGHRAVLALARSGATGRARELLDELRLDETASEDVAALRARIEKDRAIAASGATRVRRARRAAELYENVFQRSRGYYPAINAATLRLLAGDDADAEALARVAIAACDAIEGAERDSFWVAATRAEAALILGDEAVVRDSLARGAAIAGDDFSSMATTRRQLRLVCERKGLDCELLDALRPPSVVHYTGHMMAPSGRAGRFARAREGDVAREIASRLGERRAGVGYGSLASGADVLFAEALLARGAELHVVLPFDKDEFCRVSVAPAGHDFVERFAACLAKAASVTQITRDPFDGDDLPFVEASELAMGKAVLRAALLESDVVQIAVWDGRGGGRSGAGTAGDVHAWASRGLATIVVDPGPPALGEGAPPGESGRPAPPRERSLVRRAMLFGDVKGFSKLAERDIPRFVDHVMGSLGRVLDAEHAHVRSTNTWGDGLYVVLDEPVAAARCALALQAAVRAIDFEAAGLPSTLGLRLGGHVGPVFECFEPVVKRHVYFGTHVTRTARIEPVTPVGAVFVTEEFAAALALSRRDHSYVCEYAGSMAAAKGYGDMRMYVLKTKTADATDDA